MAAIASPDGAWAQIAAFLPPLAPLIVPTRVVLGDMSAIGLLAAVAISLLATLLLIRVAAGIYERSVLRTGAPISLRTALAGGATPERARGHLPPAVLRPARSPPCWAGSSWDRRAARHRPRRHRARPGDPPPAPASPPAEVACMNAEVCTVPYGPARRRGPAPRPAALRHRADRRGRRRVRTDDPPRQRAARRSHVLERQLDRARRRRRRDAALADRLRARRRRRRALDGDRGRPRVLRRDEAPAQPPPRSRRRPARGARAAGVRALLHGQRRGAGRSRASRRRRAPARPADRRDDPSAARDRRAGGLARAHRPRHAQRVGAVDVAAS